MRKFFVVMALFSLVFTIGFGRTAFGCIDHEFDLSELPQVVHEAIICHPGTGEIDESIIFRSFDRLLTQFDPGKMYLLQQELRPFFDPTLGKKYLHEFKNNDFQSYFDLILLCRKAILRSRKIRQGFFFTDSRSLELVRGTPKSGYQEYASDIDELTARLFRRYIQLISDRLVEDKEDDPEAVCTAVALAEKEFETSEEPWLKLQSTGDADDQRAVAKVILQAVVSSLDSHSNVVSDEAVRDMRERLTKQAFGTGIVPHVNEGTCFIKKIIAGSPASTIKSIHEGDTILAINGTACSTMTLEEIQQSLHSQELSTVKLSLLSGSHKRSVTVDVVSEKYTVLEGRLESEIRSTKEGKILILTLHSFYRGSGEVSSSNDINEAFKKAKKQGPIAGVILDLRDNGGGYVAEAVRVVGQFITAGVVMTAQYADGTRLVFRDVNPGVLFEGPVLVMTSKATASSAEIVAQALKDYGRAVIVGDPHTYGKGSIQLQTITDVKPNDAWENVPLCLTVGRFYTVSGYCPQSVGVMSDIIVPGLYDRPRGEDDPDNMDASIAPQFLDSLDDVQNGTKGWYLKHYLPFVEQPTDRYRKWVPELQKKSAQRLEKSSLWTLVRQDPVAHPDENLAVKRQARKLQMDEAVAIEEDLIRLSSS